MDYQTCFKTIKQTEKDYDKTLPLKQSQAGGLASLTHVDMHERNNTWRAEK